MHHAGAVFPPPFGLRSLIRGGLTQTLRALKSADIILFGGGGLFQDREKKAIFLWAWYFFVASRRKKKILFVGNSVGPLSNRLSKWLVQKVFAHIRFISLRDAHSKELLRSLGVPDERMVLASDAAFLLRKLPEKKRRRGTLIIIRGDGKVTKKSLSHILKNLPKPIRFLPMDAIDHEFSKTHSQDILLPETLSQLRDAFRSARIVVSSRLHGGILALQAETPFVMLRAAPKVEHFFSERGFSDVVFKESSRPSTIGKKCRALLKNNVQWKRKAKQARLLEQKNAKSILPYFLK